ncbi:adenylate/guanylate cyclase domain-containing protein [Roseibium sp.]|uniref:adenylate/guanylate cyclase domain-containing protein n=1 Tax=Roseibium sp. TaxID=1936156 RepID=UPI003BAABA53
MNTNATISSDEIIRWLMVEGPRLETPSALLNGYSLKLREAGLQVDRSTLGAPILHPIAKSSYVFWDLETGPEQRWFVYTPDQMEMLKASPIHKIYTRGEATSLRLDLPGERSRYPIGEDLWAEGYFQYKALPLQFSDETFKVLTLATKSPGGFDGRAKALIDATLPALTLVFEGFIARNTARTLMETYVGTRAGLRVLDGEIARGDGSTIDAVIWFSDLRGFTSLAQSRSEDDLLKLLNDYFGTLTDAIEAHSGEVLKFIGDALLAVFPHQDDVGAAVARAEAAALQVSGTDRPRTNYTFGIGLHPGSVFYGNVGGGNRLDFTVIGSSVNIASRIEGLCGALGETVLASGDFAAKSENSWRSVGPRELKGVADPLEIFAPVVPQRRS